MEKLHEQFYLPLTPEPHPSQQDFSSTGNVLRTDKTFNVKDKYIFNDKEAINRYGQTFGRFAFSTLNGSVYTVAVSDYLIGVTSLSYAASVGLPRPKDVGPGKTYLVKDEVGSAGSTTITILSTGEENIDGASSATITQNYGSKKFYSDGSNWFTHDTNPAQIIQSGVYVPTRSAEVNQDANVSPTEAQYMRVGNTVTVSGGFTFNPTLTATATSFELSLPVASNLGAEEDLAGTSFAGAIAGMGGAIKGSVANNTAVFFWISSDITNQPWSYTYSYQII